MSEARERILAVAMRLFLRHGFSTVTMDELASELGMSKKTLYQHFPNKEELLTQVLESGFASLTAELDEALEDERLDFGERLSRYLTIVAGRYASMSSAVLRDLQKSAPGPFARFEALRRSSLETRYARLLAAGVAAGEFRSDIDVRILLQMVMALAERLLSPDALHALDIAPLDAFKAITGVLLDGLRAPRDRPKPRSRGRAR